MNPIRPETGHKLDKQDNMKHHVHEKGDQEMAHRNPTQSRQSRQMGQDKKGLSGNVSKGS
jgi:hypothetical protein